MPADNIILCGMKNAGKSSIGLLLARVLGYQFIDSDESLLERHPEFSNIQSLYQSLGERVFRQQEEKILTLFSSKIKTVIATGGGVALVNNVENILPALGYIIYLRVDPTVLYQRLESAERLPSYFEKMPTPSEFGQLFKKRDVCYQQLANVVLELSTESCQSVVDHLIELREKPCGQ